MEYNNNETVTISLERYEMLRSQSMEDSRKIELLTAELKKHGRVIYYKRNGEWAAVSEKEHAEILKNALNEIKNTPLIFTEKRQHKPYVDKELP